MIRLVPVRGSLAATCHPVPPRRGLRAHDGGVDQHRHGVAALSATAKSGRPSPLKSPIETACGSDPVGNAIRDENVGTGSPGAVVSRSPSATEYGACHVEKSTGDANVGGAAGAAVLIKIDTVSSLMLARCRVDHRH